MERKAVAVEHEVSRPARRVAPATRRAGARRPLPTAKGRPSRGGPWAHGGGSAAQPAEVELPTGQEHEREAQLGDGGGIGRASGGKTRAGGSPAAAPAGWGRA